jgi:predicted rRNA methylase YqxC with S4 and FtsJ domains
VLSQVYGIDVGHGQVMGSIAQDPRVTVMERTNLRHLKPEQLPEQVRRICVCRHSSGSVWRGGGRATPVQQPLLHNS